MIPPIRDDALEASTPMMDANELVVDFVYFCEERGLDVAEAMRVLNAQEALEDDEYVTIPSFTFSDDCV
jgi:hypothetical protein